jgi:hypothetical protein
MAETLDRCQPVPAPDLLRGMIKGFARRLMDARDIRTTLAWSHVPLPWQPRSVLGFETKRASC